MNNYKAFFILISLFFSHISFSQTLIRKDSVKIDQANIWGVLADAGQNMALTVARGNFIYLQFMNASLERVGQQMPVFTEDDDLPKIVDHKTTFWKGHYYITFSSAGDRQLYLVKMDSQGNRVGNIVTVWDQDDRPANEPGKPTNDMILITTSETLYVGHFQPGTQHNIHGFDEDLNRTGDPFLTEATLPHNNVGGGLYVNEKIHLFTGSMFGGSSDLILTEWDKDFQPAAQEPRTLIDSEPDNANWFATGVAYDENTKYWYIAFQHLYPGEVLDSEHVDLAVFDQCFNLIYREHVTDEEHFRPHLLINEGFLYLTYDRAGGGVFLHKYDLLEEGFGAAECDGGKDDGGDDGKDDENGVIEIDDNKLLENSAVGTSVGTLFIDGVEEELTFELVSGEGDGGNGFFSISGDQLLSAKEFNYEEGSEYSVRVKASAGQQSVETALEIIIENVVEHELSLESSLSFGTVAVEDSSSLSLVVAHSGEDDDLEISDITVPTGYTVDVTSADLDVEQTISIAVTFSPTEATEYSGNLIISSTAGEYQVALSGTGALVQGLEEVVSYESDVLVYPSPASDIVYVELESGSNEVIEYLQLVSLSGSEMVSQAVKSQKSVSFSIEAMPSGISILLVKTNLGLIKKKIIKQ